MRRILFIRFGHGYAASRSAWLGFKRRGSRCKRIARHRTKYLTAFVGTAKLPEMASSKDFCKALEAIFAENNGPYVDVRAGDLYVRVGGKSGPNRMPSCVNVMRREKKDGDEVVAGPPSGIGPKPRPVVTRSNSPPNVEIADGIANTDKGKQFQLKCQDFLD